MSPSAEPKRGSTDLTEWETMTPAPVRRRLVVGLTALALLVAGCAGTESGTGTRADPSGMAGAPTGGETTETEPTETEPTGSEPTGSESTGSESTGTETTDDPTGSSTPTESADPDDLAGAEAAGAAFADAVNVGDLSGAFGLLCAGDQESATLKEFSEDAPPPGSFTLNIVEQVESGVFLADISFVTDDDIEESQVYIRDEDGQWCLSQDDT